MQTEKSSSTEDKKNIFYGIDCSSCEAACFGESKRLLKLSLEEHKISVRNCDCNEINEIAKQCWEADHKFSWEQKKVVDSESRLILRKNPNHVNKIFYILPGI